MRNYVIQKQISGIKNLITTTQAACGNNIELQSQWAKYLCILCAGLLENGIKEIYIEYALRTTSTPIAKYVSSKLSTIRNPKAEIFLQIASAFKDSWKEELEVFLEEDGRDAAINSIMNNRHLIAHGQSTDSRITFSQLKSYLERAIEVLEFLENQCGR